MYLLPLFIYSTLFIFNVKMLQQSLPQWAVYLKSTFWAGCQNADIVSCNCNIVDHLSATHFQFNFAQGLPGWQILHPNLAKHQARINGWANILTEEFLTKCSKKGFGDPTSSAPAHFLTMQAQLLLGKIRINNKSVRYKCWMKQGTVI